MDIKENGLGILGNEQLEWLKADLQDRSSDTPIVLFAHIPLWTVYPEWGWGTSEDAQALSYLKRFGSVRAKARWVMGQRGSAALLLSSRCAFTLMVLPKDVQ
jgi:hypothetical protein